LLPSCCDLPVYVPLPLLPCRATTLCCTAMPPCFTALLYCLALLPIELSCYAALICSPDQLPCYAPLLFCLILPCYDALLSCPAVLPCIADEVNCPPMLPATSVLPLRPSDCVRAFSLERTSRCDFIMRFHFSLNQIVRMCELTLRI
jgi:hypothetical protein